MCIKETLAAVQKFLIDPTKIKTVLCTCVPSASSHLSTKTKHKYKCNFMECSRTRQLEGVLRLSAGTTVEMTLKAKILMLETACAESTSYDHASITALLIIINSMSTYNACME